MQDGAVGHGATTPGSIASFSRETSFHVERAGNHNKKTAVKLFFISGGWYIVSRRSEFFETAAFGKRTIEVFSNVRATAFHDVLWKIQAFPSFSPETLYIVERGRLRYRSRLSTSSIVRIQVSTSAVVHSLFSARFDCEHFLSVTCGFYTFYASRFSSPRSLHSFFLHKSIASTLFRLYVGSTYPNPPGSVFRVSSPLQSLFSSKSTVNTRFRSDVGLTHPNPPGSVLQVATLSQHFFLHNSIANIPFQSHVDSTHPNLPDSILHVASPSHFFSSASRNCGRMHCRDAKKQSVED